MDLLAKLVWMYVLYPDCSAIHGWEYAIDHSQRPGQSFFNRAVRTFNHDSSNSHSHTHQHHAQHQQYLDVRLDHEQSMVWICDLAIILVTAMVYRIRLIKIIDDIDHYDCHE